MSHSQTLLSAILLVSGILLILYSVLDQDKVEKLNIWYHILVGKRKEYDFDKIVKQTRLVYYYFTLISVLGIVFSFINESIGIVFVWISLISLVGSLYYLYPRKRAV